MRPTSAARRVRASAWLGMTLALGIVASSKAAPPGAGADPVATVPVIEHNSRSFRIPFNFDPEQKAEIKEIALIVSEDQGVTWKPVDRTAPDARAIAFKAAHDGEFWFAVQTVSKDGRLYPPNSAAIEPKMKVIVDTLPPKITLEANSRRGSFVSVRWEVRDERLDRNSFLLEFKTEGDRDWRQVPVKRPVALIGEKTWDPGTAGPIVVRASIADRAKNTKEATIDLADGSPRNPKHDRADSTEVNEPPPLGSFTSNTVSGLPQFPGETTNEPPPRDGGPPETIAGQTRPGARESGYNPFDAAPRTPAGRAEPPAAAPGSETGLKPQIIPSPRFNLQYEVEDAGPSGPASVELWITLDGGRTWSRRGEDPDKKSPFPVDLGGEGTFGLTLVARSASNLGDAPPAPGDKPQYLVEVDSTPPMIKLDPVRIGTGADAGKISITWHASDLHLGPKPVLISVRGEGTTAWQPITPVIENSGKFVWTVPANAPPRFFVRVDVVDTVGNRNSDETPNTNPVMVDRTRPKSRIIGLDPSTRNAAGPIITPIR